MKLMPKSNPKCPTCNIQAKKKGFRRSKQRTTQRYFCKSCNQYFTTQPPPQKSKTYKLKIILDGISAYNLGTSLRKMSLKHPIFQNRIPKSTIHNWIKTINLPLNRLRKSIIKNPIIKHQFIHHKQPFLYQYHSLKLEFSKKFPTLITYLKEINTSLPDQIFNNSERISQVSKQPLKQSKETPTMAGGAGDAPSGVPHPILGDIKFAKQIYGDPPKIGRSINVVGVSSKEKENYAVKLANIALSITKDNKKRHDIIENFMLINDTATIATEIPIYLTEQETKTTNLTGHIDILQIRYHKLYILDYKPEPMNTKQTINQLKLYRKALSKRTNIKKHKIKLAFFNDKGYYEI